MLVLSLLKESRVAGSATARRWPHCSRASPGQRLSLQDAGRSSRWWGCFAVWSLTQIKRLFCSEFLDGDRREKAQRVYLGWIWCLRRSGQLCSDTGGCSWCFGKVAKALGPTRNAAGGAATPPCSARFSPQSQPFILSSCIQRRILAEITSPSIQAAISFSPAASDGNKSAAIQILKCCVWGISDLAIKIFDLHLAEYQRGQAELCFFPKLLPKGILLM